MSFSVKTIKRFEKDLKKLVKKYPSLKNEYIQLISLLKENPIQGKSLGNNCYKIRLAIASKGKGKSGGARIITHLQIVENVVYLLSIYDKSEKSSISDIELQEFINAIIS